MRDAEGRCIRMVGTHTHINRQKHLEAQLFAAKERAQVTLGSIGDAVLTTDALAVLDDVEVNKYHDYPDTYK